METWFQKTIGAGPPAYAELRYLRELREQMCADASPYLLAIEVESGDTVVFIRPQHAALAAAFRAQACPEPNFEPKVLLPLPYEPLPIKPGRVSTW